jgi:hypothetical protein
MPPGDLIPIAFIICIKINKFQKVIKPPDFVIIGTKIQKKANFKLPGEPDKFRKK